MRRHFRAAVGAVLIALAAATDVVPARRPRGAALFAAQAPAPAPAARAGARVDAGRLMKDLQALSAPEMEGRLTGTPGSKRAQAYVLDQFKQLKLQPLNGSFEQKFSFTSTRGRRQGIPRRDQSRRRCCPARRERDRYVLVTAHYDHLGVRNGATYHGADDNASGVAAMLAVARWFSDQACAGSRCCSSRSTRRRRACRGRGTSSAHPPVPLERIVVDPQHGHGRPRRQERHLSSPAPRRIRRSSRWSRRRPRDAPIDGALRPRPAWRRRQRRLDAIVRPRSLPQRRRAVSLFRRRGSRRLSQADGHRRQDPARLLRRGRRKW